MTSLNIKNPFNAPVYHEETVESTMNVSRGLASKGEPNGTVIAADFQEKGRGRIRGRTWQMERKINLSFTIMLRYPLIEKIPQAITLRTGLAVSFAVEEFMPELSGMVMIKWPNDVMINSKKTAGILCEADVSSKDGWIVHAGIGINVSQKEFPSGLKEKATSISLASGQDIDPDKRFSLLEKILHKLYHELEAPDWRARLDPSANYGVEGPPGGVSGVQRLYKKNEKIIFMEGEAGSGMEIKGRIDGIGENGELMIIPDGKEEACPFITGEIVLEG